MTSPSNTTSTALSNGHANDSSSNKNNNNTGDCSTWIANALADAGVDVVYGGHGGALAPLVNAVCSHPRLRWVCVRNEANASLMACAHAKLTNNLACCIATSGPGATNLTTGLMEAVADRLPVLALTGLKPRQGLHFSEFQDVDQSKLFNGGGVAFSYDVASPEALIPLLRDAVATAVTQNTCAHLAIPVDVQAATCPIPVDRPFCAAHAADRIAPSIHTIDQTMLERMAQALQQTSENHGEPRRVLIAVGARAIDAGPDILQLAEALHAPVVTRLDAKGAIDENHSLSLGIVGVHGKPGLERAAAVIETADVVLNFGVSDMTLLLCNTAGLQTRPMMEFEPTALMVSTRFRASCTCIGNLSEICKRLTECLLRSSSSSLQNAPVNFADDVATAPIKLQKQMTHSDLDENHQDKSRADLAKSVWASVRRQAKSIQEDKEKADADVVEIGDDKKKDHHHRRRRSSLAGKLMQKMAATTTDQENAVDMSIIKESISVESDLCAVADAAGVALSELKISSDDPTFGHPADILQSISTVVEDSDVVCVDTGDITLWAALCLTRRAGRTLSSERLGTMGYGLCAGVAACLASPTPSTSIVLVGDGGLQMTVQELATFQQCKRPGDRLIVVVFDNQLLGRVRFGFADALGCDLGGPDFAALAAAYGGQGYRVTSPKKAKTLVQVAPEGLTILHIPMDRKIKADMAAFKDGAITMMNSG